MKSKLFVLCPALVLLAGCETTPPTAQAAPPPPKRTVRVYVTSEPSDAYIDRPYFPGQSLTFYCDGKRTTPCDVLVEEDCGIQARKSGTRVDGEGIARELYIPWKEILTLPETEGKRHWHAKLTHTTPYLLLHEFRSENFSRIKKSPQGVVTMYGYINNIREDAEMASIVLELEGEYAIVHLALSGIGRTELLQRDLIRVLGRAKGYATLKLAGGGSQEVPLIEAGAIHGYERGKDLSYVRHTYREAARLWAEGNLYRYYPDEKVFRLTVDVPEE